MASQNPTRLGERHTAMAEVSERTKVEEALQEVRALLARRTVLEHELLTLEINLRNAFKAVPHMPVRSAATIDIEEQILEKRSNRLLRVAKGNKDVAGILNDLMYGSENPRSVWR